MAAKSKRYSDHEISTLLASDSDSESGSESDHSLLEYKTAEPRSERKGRDRTEIIDVEDGAMPSSNSISNKILLRKSEKISLRIKLRRSTEQSVYKIQMEQEMPENLANVSSPKRARSNSSGITTTTPSVSKNVNYSKRERETIMATPEKGIRNENSPRGARSRRPPLRFSSYECSPLPYSNEYENSPTSSARLRNRQPVDYNESSLQAKYEFVNATPPKASSGTRLVTRSRKRDDSLSSNDTVIDATRIAGANHKKRNSNNRPSQKETDSDTDNSSASSIRGTRSRHSTHDNKENMPGTSKRVGPISGKMLTSTRLSRSNKSDAIATSITGVDSPGSSKKKSDVSCSKKGPKNADSLGEHESDSDASTLSLEYLKHMKAECDSRANILSDRTRASSNRILDKNREVDTLSPLESSGRVKNTGTSESCFELDENKRNSKREVVVGSSATALRGEGPLYERKRKLKRDGKKREAETLDGATKRQGPEKERAEQATPKTVRVGPLKHSSLTPSLGSRFSIAIKPATPLQNARARLHVGAIPKSLPCREEEFNNIFTFLKGKLTDRSGGCIYISGVPGTGKTATVNEVVKCLEKLTAKGELGDFHFVAINGMKLTDPRQSYVQILKQLTGETVPWAQAVRALQQRFQNKSSKMTLLLVDELDYLCTKRQDVIYNILDWPSKTSAHLVVITIANTMDLPERVLMSRVASRLGLTRLTFQPYNHKQLQEIVIARLKDFDSFRSEAVQLVARKVSAVSGDARRALDICRRAAEITESRGVQTISLQDVSEAISEMIATPKIQAIQRCSMLEKLFLLAISAEVARTSVEEVIFKDAYMQLKSLCSFEGVKVTNVSETLAICARLAARRILICDHSRSDIYQKILPNVSADDIHYATQQATLLPL